MKLPPHILKAVEWFEYSSNEGNPPYSQFVLHFKGWWRLSKTIYIEAVFNRHDVESDRDVYRLSPEAVELLAQLKEQCKDQA